MHIKFSHFKQINSVSIHSLTSHIPNTLLTYTYTGFIWVCTNLQKWLLVHFTTQKACDPMGPDNAMEVGLFFHGDS